MIFLSFGDVIGDIAQKIFPNPSAIVVQLIATFILFLIVKHFLYKPVKEYIKKRQDYVEKQLSEADSKNSEAELNLQQARKVHQNNIKETDTLLKESRMQAKKEREQILNETKVEVNRLKENAKSEIELEKQKARDEIKAEMVDLSIEMTKKILKREVSSKDDKKSLESLIDEVNKDD